MNITGTEPPVFFKGENMNPKNCLRVFETFASTQGESTFAGRLCYFIRLAGCNLACSYCDTVKAQAGSSFTREATAGELASEAVASGLKLVEITGGEPMMQGDCVGVLCELLISSGMTVLMETNGSLDLSTLPPEVIRIVDYKTPSSGESGKMFIENVRSLRPCDQVKFVISDRHDFDFSCQIIKKYRIDRQTEHILMSPVLSSLPGETLVEWMLKEKVPARLNLQLHKFMNGVR